jgi:hypothetical protein
VTEEQDRDRRRLRRYIEQEQLASFMNDTKWRELRMAMVERTEKPRYRVQCLLSQPTPPDNWDGDWFYHLPTFAWIEWLDIDPIHVKSRGHLLEAARVDLTQEILDLLRSLSIPCETQDGLIRIYGYRRPL